MTGRRRRTGDEFADEHSWTDGEDSGRYGPPGGHEPPWSPAEEPGDPWSPAQQPGPQWQQGHGPGGSARPADQSQGRAQGQEADRSARAGRHSAPPPRLGAPSDGYPAAGTPRPRSPEPDPGRDLPPWQDLPWQDSSPRVPRQQPSGGQAPPPQAPPPRGAGRPGPSRQPGEGSVPYGAPTGRYPVPPGEAAPPAGDRYGSDAPADPYGAPDARGRGRGDRGRPAGDSFAGSGYPGSGRDDRGRGSGDGLGGSGYPGSGRDDRGQRPGDGFGASGYPGADRGGRGARGSGDGFGESGYSGAEQHDRGGRGAGGRYPDAGGRPPRRRQQPPPGDYSPAPDGYPGTGRRADGAPRDGGYAPGAGAPRDGYIPGEGTSRDGGYTPGGEAPRGSRYGSGRGGRRTGPGRDGHPGRDGYDNRDGYPGAGRDEYGAREADRDDDYDGFFAPADRGSRAGGGGGSGGYDDGDDRPARPRRRRRGRYAALIAVIVIVLPVCIGAYFAYKVIAGHFFPADYSGPGTGSIVVQIKPGDTATLVGERLYTVGVVASARAFVLAAEASPNGSGLQPGFYRMHLHMNAKLAFALLLKPSSRVQLTVTIPEGLRATSIVATLAHRSGIPLADFQQALRHASTLGLPSYAHGNPEGYLFPATYTLQPGMTATSVLQAMVKSFDNEAAGVSLTQSAAHVHLSPAQVIVVASLAQAEGGKISDFSKITRVIYNRLAAGMPLQFDSTVMYALHTYGIRASSSQLNVNSPYNTYRHKGLPPGPIDSPGDAAIRAALHPASGNWLYFVTVNPKTRQTDFTSSYAVFQQLQAQSQGG